VKRFPKNNPFVFDVVNRLHQLSLATSPEWYNTIDQRGLSNLYFETLQAVISIQLDEPWNETIPGGSQGQEAALMFQVWMAGLSLFIWGTVRQVRVRLGQALTRCICDPLFARVKDLLEGTGSYHAWPRGKSLEPVMATLFYGVESCDFSSPWRNWCVESLSKVTEILKLKSAEEFSKALDNFPSTEGYKEAAGKLWVEMKSGGGRNPPTLTLSPLQ